VAATENWDMAIPKIKNKPSKYNFSKKIILKLKTWFAEKGTLSLYPKKGKFIRLAMDAKM